MAQIYTRFILKNDTEANWISNNPALLKGEIGIAIDKNKFKIGVDGVKTWNQLDYAGLSLEELQALIDENKGVVYEGVRASKTQTDADAIAAALGSSNAKQDDVCIIKTLISGDDTESDTSDDIYEYAAFIYDGTQWKAMDGKVSSDTVILSEDIVFAGSYTQVGNITKTQTGTTTVSAKGKSLTSFLKSLYTKVEQPTITANPSVSATLNQAGSYEVGSTVSPTYSVSLSAGSYKFGPATGITAKTWSVTNSTEGDGNTKTTASGSFGDVSVTDSTNYTISATATYDAGAVAVDNMGDPSDPTVQIAAGSKSGTSSAITGYRKPFWGYKLTANALVDPTTVSVRDLQESGYSVNYVPGSGVKVNKKVDGVSVNKTAPSTYTIPADTKQVFFAVKAGTYSSMTVKNGSALDAPVAFTKVASGVQVADKAGSNETAYDLWYANFDAGTSGSAELKITWVK